MGASKSFCCFLREEVKFKSSSTTHSLLSLFGSPSMGAPFPFPPPMGMVRELGPQLSRCIWLSTGVRHLESL